MSTLKIALADEVAASRTLVNQLGDPTPEFNKLIESEKQALAVSQKKMAESINPKPSSSKEGKDSTSSPLPPIGDAGPKLIPGTNTPMPKGPPKGGWTSKRGGKGKGRGKGKWSRHPKHKGKRYE